MGSDSERAIPRSISMPKRQWDAIDGMMKTEDETNTSAFIARLLRPITEKWLGGGGVLASPDRVRAHQEARLLEVEARIQLAHSEAKTLRKELGRDPDSPLPAPAPVKRGPTVEEFLDAPGRVEMRETFLRQSAVRAGLDPDLVVAGIPAARARSRAREDAAIMASRELRLRREASQGARR